MVGGGEEGSFLRLESALAERVGAEEDGGWAGTRAAVFLAVTAEAGALCAHPGPAAASAVNGDRGDTFASTKKEKI